MPRKKGSGIRPWNYRGWYKGSHNYIFVHTPTGYVLGHVLVAEKALGKKLPAKAVVHHVNGDPSDNRPSNLVICEDQMYHMLLHVRQDAYRATGDANKRRCWICRVYDDPGNLRYKTNKNSPRGVGHPYHLVCAAKRMKVYSAQRRLRTQK